MSSNCAKRHLWTRHSSQKFRNTPEQRMAIEPKNLTTLEAAYSNLAPQAVLLGHLGLKPSQPNNFGGHHRARKQLHGACQQYFDHFLWRSFDHKRSVDEPLHMLKCCHSTPTCFNHLRPAATCQLSLHSLFCFGQCSDNKTKGDLGGFSHGRLKLRLKLV